MQRIFLFIISACLLFFDSEVRAQPGTDSAYTSRDIEWAPDKWSLLLSFGPTWRDKELIFMAKGFGVDVEFERRKWKNVYQFADLYAGIDWTDKQMIRWATQSAASRGEIKGERNARILSTQDFWQVGIVGGLSGDLINLPRYRMNLGVGVGLAYFNYPNTTVEYTPVRTDTQYRIVTRYTAPNILGPTLTLRALIDYKLSERWALTLIGRLRFYRQNFDASSGDLKTRWGDVIDFAQMPPSGVVPFAGLGIRWVH